MTYISLSLFVFMSPPRQQTAVVLLFESAACERASKGATSDCHWIRGICWKNGKAANTGLISNGGTDATATLTRDVICFAIHDNVQFKNA